MDEQIDLQFESDLAVVRVFKAQFLRVRNGEFGIFNQPHSKKYRDLGIIRTENYFKEENNGNGYFHGKRHVLTAYGEKLLDTVLICPEFPRCYRYDRRRNSKCNAGQGPCEELKTEV